MVGNKYERKEKRRNFTERNVEVITTIYKGLEEEGIVKLRRPCDAFLKDFNCNPIGMASKGNGKVRHILDSSSQNDAKELKDWHCKG